MTKNECEFCTLKPGEMSEESLMNFDDSGIYLCQLKSGQVYFVAKTGNRAVADAAITVHFCPACGRRLTGDTGQPLQTVRGVVNENSN